MDYLGIFVYVDMYIYICSLCESLGLRQAPRLSGWPGACPGQPRPPPKASGLQLEVHLGDQLTQQVQLVFSNPLIGSRVSLMWSGAASYLDDQLT